MSGAAASRNLFLANRSFIAIYCVLGRRDMTTRLCRLLQSFILLVLIPAVARADLYVGIASPVYHFDETTGANLGQALFVGETVAGIGLGSDGNLYLAGNVLGQGIIVRYNPLTGQKTGVP